MQDDSKLLWYNQSVARLYSLWITPSPKLKKSLSQIIEELAKKYKSPTFEAHMTLLGNIELEKKMMIRKTIELANSIKPFTLQLGEISFSTTYFQSVFVRVKTSASLMEANIKAKNVFKVNNDVFMPHVSLLYGNHSMKLREKIVSAVSLPKNKTFEAEKIIITPSTPNPKDWKHLAEIPL